MAQPDLTSSPVAASANTDKKSNITNGVKKATVGPTNNTTTTTTTSTNKSTAAKQQQHAAAPLHPAYVELTYIPAHGSEHHCDVDFFKRVRARHYVLSAVETSETTLNALCEGKEVWEDKQLQVSLIPTYESEALRRWFVHNEERLTRLRIDVLPAACHATITMDDNPDLTCQVYKLEF